AGSTGDVRVGEYRRNSVAIEADVTRPSWLLFADSDYPGWHASVDGHEQEIYTADYILRAVPLGAGLHTVRFWFLPSLFVPSALLSGATLGMVVAGLVWGGRRKVKTHPPNPLP